jgi:serine protease Do
MRKHWLTTAVLIGCSTMAIAAAPEDPTPQAEPRTKIRVAPRARIATPPGALAYAVAYGDEMMGGSYLGVDIAEITSDRVAALKLKEERGVEIKNVDQDAPAGKAGLKVGDVILDFNGQRVEGEEGLRRMLRETPGGRTVTLGIWRDGAAQQVKVTPASKKEYMAKMYKDKVKEWKFVTPEPMVAPRVEIPRIEMPAIDVVVRSYSRTTGMMVDNLTPQLGEFFGVKSGEGVLVRSVEKGSVAEAAGLKAGDVIVKVDDERISDRNDFNRALRRKEGKTAILVVREKREQTINMNVPPRRAPRGDDESFLRFPDFEKSFEFGDFEFTNEDLDFDLDLDELAPGYDRVALPKRTGPAFAFAAPLALPKVAAAVDPDLDLIEVDDEALSGVAGQDDGQCPNDSRIRME